MSQSFTSGGQSIGASALASVLPMNIQGWFHLGWTGLISLLTTALITLYGNSLLVYFADCRKHFLLSLAALGFSYSSQDLRSSLWYAGSIDLAFELLVADPVPLSGMEPEPPALGAKSLRHWTTREFSYKSLTLYLSPSSNTILNT